MDQPLTAARIESMRHDVLDRVFEPNTIPVVHLPLRTMARLFATLDAYREIVQAVANYRGDYNDNLGSYECQWCVAISRSAVDALEHVPLCPVTKARALLDAKAR